MKVCCLLRSLHIFHCFHYHLSLFDFFFFFFLAYLFYSYSLHIILVFIIFTLYLMFAERSAYRILFLVSGIVLMSVASWLSNSLVFYYSGAMAIGIILLILVVLFQVTSYVFPFLFSCFFFF